MSYICSSTGCWKPSLGFLQLGVELDSVIQAAALVSGIAILKHRN